jgi:hypothetical protein
MPRLAAGLQEWQTWQRGGCIKSVFPAMSLPKIAISSSRATPLRPELKHAPTACEHRYWRAWVYNATAGKPKMVSGSKEKPNETDRIPIGWSCNAGRGCRLHGARS